MSADPDYPDFRRWLHEEIYLHLPIYGAPWEFDHEPDTTGAPYVMNTTLGAVLQDSGSPLSVYVDDEERVMVQM